MKKSRFSEEQITYALKQVDAGTPVADVCRQLGVSDQLEGLQIRMRVRRRKHNVPASRGDTSREPADRALEYGFHA